MQKITIYIEQKKNRKNFSICFPYSFHFRKHFPFSFQKHFLVFLTPYLKTHFCFLFSFQKTFFLFSISPYLKTLSFFTTVQTCPNFLRISLSFWIYIQYIVYDNSDSFWNRFRPPQVLMTSPASALDRDAITIGEALQATAISAGKSPSIRGTRRRYKQLR